MNGLGDLSLHEEGIASLLATSPVLRETAAATRITELLRKNDGALGKTLDQLRSNPTDERLATELEFTAGAAALAREDAAFVETLHGLRASGDIVQLNDLARFDNRHWLSLLQSGKVKLPIERAVEPSAQDIAALQRSYAQMLTERVSDSFPMAVIQDRLKRARDPDATAVVSFLERAPDFVFGTQPIARFLRDHPETLKGAREPERLTAQLRTMQRVFAMTSRYDEMKALMDAGLTSAASIAEQGRNTFTEDFSERLGSAARAAEVFDVAARISGTVHALLVGLPSDLNALPKVILGANREPEIPDWKSLFGSLEMCDCDACCSVLSPAAYLADLLHFLRLRKLAGPTGLQDAIKVLFARRPDIEWIELSCVNTNTTLPYIDLVNEILENVVSPVIDWTVPVTPATQAMLQTTWTADELAAEPEHVNPGAYAVLASRPYPWTLPFDLWTETARAYLILLGTSRQSVMETLFAKPWPAALSDPGVVAESLGLIAAENTIIVGAGAFQPWEYWGYAAGAPGTFVNDQQQARTFLRNSGLSYEDTLVLLQTRFVNPGGAIGITLGPKCDLDTATIAWPDAAALDRVHRFVRVWRKCSLSMGELDEAIRALGGGAIDQPFLMRLSHALALRKSLDAAFSTVLTWWGNIGTLSAPGPSPSLYDQLFQNRAVVGDPTRFALNAARTNLQVVSALNDPAAMVGIFAATGIGPNEFALLTDSTAAAAVLHLPAADITDNLLNLANLSHILRVASFSRALGIRFGEVLALRAITGIDPFDAANTADTLRFVDIVKNAQASGLSVAQLDYLLRDNDLGLGSAAPVEAQIALELETLRAALQRALAEKPADPAFDPTGVLERERLTNAAVQGLADSVKLDTGIVLRLMSGYLVRPSAPLQPAINAYLDAAFAGTAALTEAAFPDAFALWRRLHKVALFIDALGMGARELDWLCTYGPPNGWLDLNALPLSPQASGAALFGGWESFVSLLRIGGTLPGGVATLTAFLAAAHDSAATVGSVLDQLAALTGWNRVDLDFAVTTGLTLAFPADYRNGLALTRLKPVFDLLRRLGVSAAQAWSWTPSVATQAGATAIVQAVKARYDVAEWPPVGRRARDTIRVRQRDSLVAAILHPGGGLGSAWQNEDELFDQFLIDIKMDACQLTSRIKQAISSVQLFVQRCLMHLELAVIPSAAQRADWAELWTWMANFRVWEANRKVFLYPENWIEPELRDSKTPFFEELENEILQNDITPEALEATYLHYLQKLDDVAHLQMVGIFDETFSTPKLAYGASGQAVKELQILLNDAGALPLVIEDGKFGIATYMAVRAFQTAHGLTPDGIVNTQTWAALSPRLPNVETIHAVGRTRGTPGIYYHRKRFGSGLDEWTAWQRVDPDIDVEQVMPLVWHGRTFLFWPIFGEITNTTGTKVPTWQIRVGWSEYRNGQWQARRISSDHPSTGLIVIHQDAANNATGSDTGNGSSHHLLKTALDGDQLLIGAEADMKANANGGIRAPVWFRFGGCYRQPAFDGAKLDSPADLDGPGDPIRPQGTVASGNLFQVAAANGALFLPNNSLFATNPVGVKALGQTHGTAFLVTSHQDPRFDAARPFFFQDSERTFYVTPYMALRFIPGLFAFYTSTAYLFEPHYHPYVCDFIARLNSGGVNALLQRSMQVGLQNSYFDRPNGYAPVPSKVDARYPIDDVDFTPSGAYSPYNWEVFFHIPLMLATRLSTNQRFEDAQAWFHYIFDPMDTSAFPSPQRFWRTRPFFEAAKSPPIQTLLLLLSTPDTGLTADEKAQKASVRQQIARWRRDPFNPHLIARMRPAAYQKTVVMKYLDNLIAWADQLFSRDTMEAINEATQLYILAERILGVRPEKIPAAVAPKVQTYHSLELAGLDEFSNALVEGEDLLIGMGIGVGSAPPSPTPPPIMTLAFCVPPNDKLLGYWDTIADRLFKIRNCMTLDGVVRPLPLFEPPIDPALLVRAAAAGLDLSAVLNELAAPAPQFRFSVMIERALQVCAEVKSLGALLLGVLEKRDGEANALLHADHDIAALKDMSDLKVKRIEESNTTLSAMQTGLDLLKRRHDYYKNIQHLSAWEISGLVQSGVAVALDGVAFGLDLAAAHINGVPYVTKGSIGSSGSALLTTEGGALKGTATEAWARALRTMGGIFSQTAAMSNTMGAYERRGDDWDLQRDLSAIEMVQASQSILAQQVVIAAATRDLQNNDAMIERAQDIRSVMRGKFTNAQLYDWMVGQISGLYFQLNQLACDVARRAERTYQLELGVDTTFIQFGYWNSLYKGLLAGERLHHDVQRMKAAYADRRTRELELTKFVSLASLDPVALLKLRTTNECFVELPEALFDMDYPGHYMRRIKSVSVTIPCVTGPYISVSATLTLLKSSVRHDPTLLAGKYARDTSITDPRFRDSVGPVQTIATSHAQSDSGLFELNFHDERYLPFEMAGAISSWHMELSPLAQFDYTTITDVVLQVRYTSRETAVLKTKASTELAAALNAIALADGRKGPTALFSLKHRFTSEWVRFVGAVAPGADQVQTFRLGSDLFPFYLRSRKIKIARIQLLALSGDAVMPPFDLFVTPPGAVPDATKDKISLLPNPIYGGALHGVKAWLPGQEKEPGVWTVRIAAADFASLAGGLKDIQFAAEYTAI